MYSKSTNIDAVTLMQYTSMWSLAGVLGQNRISFAAASLLANASFLAAVTHSDVSLNFGPSHSTTRHQEMTKRC